MSEEAGKHVESLKSNPDGRALMGVESLKSNPDGRARMGELHLGEIIKIDIMNKKQNDPSPASEEGAMERLVYDDFKLIAPSAPRRGWKTPARSLGRRTQRLQHQARSLVEMRF